MKVNNRAALAIAIIIISSAAIIVALRGNGGSQEFDPASDIQTPVTKAGPSLAKPPVLLKKVEKLEIDLNGRRVLLPGEGWISLQAFWDIYYNAPQKLPGDIDFELLHELEALTESERSRTEGINQLPQQLVDMPDDTLDPALTRSTP